jgi:murein DD-endopeptidase MepM/ murein hydrolase activator NlpD
VSDRLWQGAFRLPVDVDPAPNFGQRRILNGQPRSPHAGVDFGARRGAPVVAPARGRVVLAEPLFFSGRTVILDHGLGLFSLYGHLSTLSVKVGQRVETGTPLGAVGATGRATGPHLHWAVRLGGARVDPLALVRGGE